MIASFEDGITSLTGNRFFENSEVAGLCDCTCGRHGRVATYARDVVQDVEEGAQGGGWFEILSARIFNMLT